MALAYMVCELFLSPGMACRMSSLVRGMILGDALAGIGSCSRQLLNDCEEIKIGMFFSLRNAYKELTTHDLYE